ncbi:extracellular solute-binding protein [Georgenia sp. SUBG003]|uniref:extracellular solute-binding protein n=1 Tax=Georgenia sp. SUBG003 TaxID=1497974 RepID=UPI003AB10B82
MNRRTTTIGAAALAASALVLAGCGSSDDAGSEGGGDDVLRLWHFESDVRMGIAWDEAIKVFEEETGATVEFEAKSFEQIRSTASQVLNSDEAPDILEYNKGNATAGLLASQGLLSPLDDVVEEYGWDDQLAPALQTTARYDENGVMGSGSWYGVPNYGEFVPAPQWIPQEPTTQAYRSIFATEGTPVVRWLLNSVVAATAQTLVILVTASMAAYALARVDFRGKKIAFAVIIATLFVPPVILLIPNYLVVGRLGWLDTLLAVILPGRPVRSGCSSSGSSSSPCPSSWRRPH